MNHLAEVSGWIACSCVLATFLMRRMRPLRLAAIASNIAFIAYATQLELVPILLLHIALLPINLWRLREQGQADRISQALPRWSWAVTTLTLVVLLAPGRTFGAGVAASPSARIHFLEIGGLRDTLVLPAHRPPPRVVLPIADGQGSDGLSARRAGQPPGGGFTTFDMIEGKMDASASRLAVMVSPASAMLAGVPIGVFGYAPVTRHASLRPYYPATLHRPLGPSHGRARVVDPGRNTVGIARVGAGDEFSAS